MAEKKTINDLLDHLLKSGTGKAKLAVIEKSETVNDALANLIAAGHGGTASKVRQWVASNTTLIEDEKVASELRQVAKRQAAEIESLKAELAKANKKVEQQAAEIESLKANANASKPDADNKAGEPAEKDQAKDDAKGSGKDSAKPKGK